MAAELKLIEGGGESEIDRSRQAREMVLAGYRAALDLLHLSDADYYPLLERRSQAEVLLRNMDWPGSGA